MANASLEEGGNPIASPSNLRAPVGPLQGNLMRKAQAFFVRSEGSSDHGEKHAAGATPASSDRGVTSTPQLGRSVMNRLAIKARELVTAGVRPQRCQEKTTAGKEEKTIPPKEQAAVQAPKCHPRRPFEKVNVMLCSPWGFCHLHAYVPFGVFFIMPLAGSGDGPESRCSSNSKKADTNYNLRSDGEPC